MERFVYKITFLKGPHKGHYYVGQHSTNQVEDNYTGSGKFPIRYFKRYGKILGETYQKEILGYANSQTELDKLESRYVNLQDPLCRNIVPGGITNRCTNKGKKLPLSWRQHIQGSIREKWKDPDYRSKQVGQKRSEETKQKISKALTGRTRSAEQVSKLKGRNKGTVWVNRDNVELRVSVENLDEYLSSGWSRGRSALVRTQLGSFNRKKVQNPQYIENLKAGTQKAWDSKERRNHISKVMRHRVGMIDLEGKVRTVKPEEIQEKLSLGWTRRKSI